MKNFHADIKKNQKIILYAIIAISLLYADYSLLIKPTLTSIGKTGPMLAQTRRQLAADKSLVANAASFKSQIQDIKEKMAYFDKRFSTKQEISEILSGLSGMAKDSQVKIVSIRPHPAIDVQSAGTGVGVYQKFPISIHATCGYHQLGTFLNRFAKEDIFMAVSDIKITADSKDPSQHLVYLLVNTYVLGEA